MKKTQKIQAKHFENFKSLWHDNDSFAHYKTKDGNNRKVQPLHERKVELIKFCYEQILVATTIIFLCLIY